MTELARVQAYTPSHFTWSLKAAGEATDALLSACPSVAQDTLHSPKVRLACAPSERYVQDPTQGVCSGECLRPQRATEQVHFTIDPLSL